MYFQIPPRLNLAALSRGLTRLYGLRPFRNERIRCGKLPLVVMAALVAVGVVGGLIVGALLAFESLPMAGLNGGLVAALIANLLAIVWIANLGGGELVLVSVPFETVPAEDPAVRSADGPRLDRPPRRVA